MRAVQGVATALAFSKGAFAAFGFTASGNGYSVDTDGGLVFQINKYYVLFVTSSIQMLIMTGPMATLPA